VTHAPQPVDARGVGALCGLEVTLAQDASPERADALAG
jgi:hypothetical protein